MDIFFNLFKIKFIYLNNLFAKLNLNNIKTINLFINLESILSTLHKPYIEDMLQTLTKKEVSDYYKCLIANIINLAAHYRLFFTRAKVTSNIIFYYNDFKTYDLYNNSVYVKGYRKHYFMNYHSSNYSILNQIVIDGVDYASTICEYVNSVFMLSSDRLESSVIPYLCLSDKKLKADLNLMLTKDLYDLQYVNKNFLLLYPAKEESIILARKNVIPFLRFTHEMGPENYDLEINPLLLPFILSVLGDKKRSLEKIRGIGFKKLYKGIEKLYYNDFISDEEPSSFNIENLSNFVRDNDGMFKLGVKESIGNNYFSIDLDRQLNVAPKIYNQSILEMIYNKYDNNNLKKLNDKIFSDYPLHLVELNNYSPNILKDIR